MGLGLAQGKCPLMYSLPVWKILNGTLAKFHLCRGEILMNIHASQN